VWANAYSRALPTLHLSGTVVLLYYMMQQVTGPAKAGHVNKKSQKFLSHNIILYVHSVSGFVKKQNKNFLLQ